MTVLVAGIGNIFFGDDGFGSSVARGLLEAGVPDGVKVEDFGIRGLHLAYELLEDYDTVVLIDAVSRGDPPGTISVIEPDPSAQEGALAAMDAHGMHPEAVLAMVNDLGGRLNRVLVVGCEAADTEDGIGLSDPVAGAVPVAVGVVLDLIATAVNPRERAS